MKQVSGVPETLKKRRMWWGTNRIIIPTACDAVRSSPHPTGWQKQHT